jgi:prenyl protein peptidase
MYTTIFGAYATFLYIRTGSLFTVILVHAFCNWSGLPRIWGRVGPIEPLVRSDGEECKDRRVEGDTRTNSQATNVSLGVGWTVAYYIFLVAGAIGFWRQLWVLTESSSALALFVPLE